ncbi:hypothetical protein [Amycolatopsis sp. lyj-84]|uniref:hypothetical protein n=1 Tax=Amycolatopsis sp. lyj-84 TaxID=2789284 RepID=UPI00397A6CF5
MTTSTPPASKKDAKAAASVKQALRDLDLDYGKTLTLSIWGLSRVGVGHVGVRVKHHSDAKKARETAAKDYGEFGTLREDNPEMVRLRKEIALMAVDAGAAQGVVHALHQKTFPLQKITLYRKCSKVTLSNAENLLAFTLKRSNHVKEIYGESHKYAARDASAAVGKDVYCDVVELHTRMRKCIDDIVLNLAVCRQLVVKEMSLQRYAAVAENDEFRVGGKKFTGDEVTSAIKLTKEIFKGANTGAGVAASVVPEEGTSQALSAANLVGGVMISEFGAIAESLDRKRRAKQIMKDPQYKQQADEFLAKHPLAILDYIIKRNEDDLERALCRAEPAAAAFLSVASYGLDLTGVGGVVAKCVFPFVFPTVKTLVTEFFSGVHKEARKAEEASGRKDLAAFKATMIAEWAALNDGRAVDRLIEKARTRVKAKAELSDELQDEVALLIADFDQIKDVKTREKMLKKHAAALSGLGLKAAAASVEKANELGGYLTPQWLIDGVIAKSLRPVVVRVLGYVDPAHDPGLISNVEMMKLQDGVAEMAAVELKYARA